MIHSTDNFTRIGISRVLLLAHGKERKDYTRDRSAELNQWACLLDDKARLLTKKLGDMVPEPLSAHVTKLLCFGEKPVRGKTWLYPLVRDGTLALQPELILQQCGFSLGEANRITVAWHWTLVEPLRRTD